MGYVETRLIASLRIRQHNLSGDCFVGFADSQ